MCGIIGYIGNRNSIKAILNGLENLEYRGYDSAGIAYVNNNKVNIKKEKGRIKNLKAKLDLNINSNLAIGHTRWATHGEPSTLNSHPHNVGRITIVHNGIIENYSELKDKLIKKGYEFKTNTDTEIACALLDNLYNGNAIETIEEFKKQVIGAYAIGMIINNDYNNLYAIKKDSPLVIGIGDNENLIASDIPSILEYTNKYIPLNNGDIAVISNDIKIYKNNKEIDYEIKTYNGNKLTIDKNGYEHFMLKEIYEQSLVFKETIYPYINNLEKLKELPDLSKYTKIDIVACGSAYHSGLIGKNLIEEYVNIPVNVEIASEYRYKKLFLDNKSLVILISQSGETADTLAALNIAKTYNATTLSIVNVVDSSIARSSDIVIYTKAGTEIAVATTKAYLAQISILGLISLYNSYLSKKININTYIKEIKKIPELINQLINNRTLYKKIASKIYRSNDVFFIGRSIDYAIAKEGSLKLKEIAYINSSGYQAGELKHGTISLIEEGTPVIGIVTDKKIADKTISNIKECKSRGAKIIMLVTQNLDIDNTLYDELIIIPNIDKLFVGVLSIIPLQLLGYEVAYLRGCDIDKPKNLAKSVTVE